MQKRNNCVFSMSRLAGELADGATYRGIPFRVRRSKLRVEIAVEDSLAAATVEEVVRVVNLGDPGDDKVFVVPMDEDERQMTDLPLTPHGELNARSLGERLKKMKFATVLGPLDTRIGQIFKPCKNCHDARTCHKKPSVKGEQLRAFPPLA